MKTFSISTLGCKVNQYESQQVRQFLEDAGWRQVPPEQVADLLVVNTCCVTATASAKARQFIRKHRRKHPHAKILVCGCLATLDSDELPQFDPQVVRIRRREDLAGTLTRLTGASGNSSPDETARNHPDSIIRPNPGRQFKNTRPELPTLSSFTGQTRAFLKIQDGCDGRCTYCIIPQTRPQIQSKPLDQILQEARDLVAAGHKEIVVTGVYTGAYGLPTTRRRQWPTGGRRPLSLCLEQLARVEGLQRIRISSLEPADLTDDLVDVMARFACIVPHVHLSLQSGSDRILRRMCRQYRIDEFLQVVDRVKTRLDRPAITTDVIVGFPGETEQDFQQTLEVAETVGFAKIHVFPFSPRRNTPAARLSDPVAPAVVQERAARLRQLERRLGRRFRDAFLGETLRVLVEQATQDPYGLSDRYIRVRWNASAAVRPNDLIGIRVEGHGDDGLVGRVVPCPATQRLESLRCS